MRVIIPLLLFVIIYYQIRHALWASVSQGQHALIAFGLLILGMMSAWRISYDQLSRPFARFHRLISLAVLCFLIVDPTDFTLVNDSAITLARQIAFGYWVALVCALLSLYKPSALLFPSFYLMLVNASSVAITGFSSDRLASVTLLESAQFLSLSVLVLSGLRRYSQSFSQQANAKARYDELALACMFLAISLHLSHYFWSGFEKLKVGEYLWTWASDNQTQNLVLSALYRGTLPTENFLALTQWLFDKASSSVQWFNAFAVVIQIATMAAFLHLSILRVLSLLYDAMHIGIYLLTGLLLWPWVANNLAILYAVKGVDRRALNWKIKLCCIVTIAMGGFQNFGNSSRLAWWDLRDITGTFVQAKTDDDQWHDVPMSYFNSHGRIMSLQAGQVSRPGHYPPTGWGASRQYDSSRMLGQCVEPREINSEAAASALQELQPRIKAFLLAHHRKLLAREVQYSRAHPYNGLRYLSSKTDMPDGIETVQSISAYRFVYQSVCLDLVNGTLIKNLVKQDEVIYKVPPE